MRNQTIWCLALSTFFAGCAVNPVTGDRELILVSGEQELAMGAQNYVPMQQSQGGPYDVDPALTQYVQAVGMQLAEASGVALPYEFTVLNNSVPNAWALPGGKIAINRGLLTELKSEAELAAVLGHEIVHAAGRHTAKQMSRGMLMQGLVVATSVATNDSSYGDLAVGGASVAAQMTMMKYGRDAELESDKYGMRYMSKAGYDPQGAVTLQETFVRLSEGKNQDWLSGLFASHPPSQERVKANRKSAAKRPAGGKLGVESFNAAMKRTLAAKPAYDAYDEGRKALSEKETDAALAHANEALTLFPNEAHFHALRGDVRLVNDQYDMAVTNYNRAIDRRGDFFYYHLQRGIAKHELGQIDAAISDLETSLQLLPTAPAHFTLGTIKEQRGPLEEAINHYKVVAKSGGEYGKVAYAALVRLELPQQPAAYVASVCGDDGSGQIVVQVRNDTSVIIAGVQAQFQYVDSGGDPRLRTQNFSGQIAPGKIASVRTGLAPYAGTRCEAKVTNARIVE
ncbi:MAG: M48 family metalloprotease [Gammaproteobacteria bacterium]|nr:M48 family metalloprotease [Gammaproteobacteria bacterium]MDH3749651.1 M48 family metalloprotease [Gammaproteobacteria bacterium]MDH3805405.1 M48 family metalloprotease [Gammaproteobacteria bacterium]